MKNDSIETKIKVLIVSIILVALIVYLFFIDKELEWGILKIISLFFAVMWVFFFPPTIKYIFNWFRNCSVEESIYAGYQIGYYGIVGIILVDPIIGIMYFFNKKLIKNGGSGNIVMVGWYIQ